MMSNSGKLAKYNDYSLLASFLELFPRQCYCKLHSGHSLKTSASWGFKNRINSDLHLIFVKAGRGCYEMADRKEPLEKDKVIFVSAGCCHTASADPNDTPAIIPIRFGIYNIRNQKMMVFPLHPFCIAISTSRSSTFTRLFEQLHQCLFMNQGAISEGLANNLLQQILMEMYFEHLKTPDKDPRIERVKEYIDKHPTERKTPEELARIATLSVKYFSKLFHRQVGYSPIDYMIRARCHYGEFLLQNSERSVKDIALSLGYPDQYAFSKQYKQVVKRTPRER